MFTKLKQHKIKTTISLPKLRELQSLALESTNYDYESAEYRVTAIILDTAHYRLFRPVRSDQSTDAKTHFIKLDFINKGIDAVNLPSILRSKSVTETVPTYFKEKEPPIISYTYTKTIASKIFNFSSTLSDLDYHQFHNNPTQCECNTSSHLYQPYGHVITGDLSIIPNSKLRDLIAKGPKYREPYKVDWDKNLSLLCEAVDQYALQWTKREMVELSVLSSWKEMVKGQIEERISKLKQNSKQSTGKVLQNADVKACLSDLHNKYVFVPEDKAPNNIIIICKRYYIETLIKELGLDNSSTTTGNSAYTPCQISSEDIVNTHDTFMKSFGIELSDDDKRLPYLYWTPKLHKSPVKHRFITGSSKCTTKQLSSLLTKILTVIKTGQEKYCSIKTSHTGVNNMWILKNSTNLLSSLGHLGVHKATSIQTFDFSTLYTSIPHDLLKSRMNNIINNAFKHKNGATRYTHIKVGRNKSHFTSDPLNGDNKYTANDICKMIEFLVDNIYIRFGGQLFRQMVGIPMGTNCAPLLADLFLYSYENEFLDKLIKEGKRKLARRFNLSYRYIDDLISFNNKRFKEFISDIYPKELTISETTESTSVASYLDLLFTRDRSNNITTKLYDKRDAFGFHIVNFPFMSSNIPSAPAYGVYASQLVRYARCCSNYSDFLIRHRALVKRLLSQGYKVNRLSNTFKKFYGRHTDLVGQYKKNVCQMFADSIS